MYLNFFWNKINYLYFRSYSSSSSSRRDSLDNFKDSELYKKLLNIRHKRLINNNLLSKLNIKISLLRVSQKHKAIYHCKQFKENHLNFQTKKKMMKYLRNFL